MTLTQKHEHSHGEPTFTFSEDGKSAKAVFACGCGDEQEVTAEVSAKVKTEAACTEKGVTTYTATAEFEGGTYTAEKDVADIPALGHNFVDGKCTYCGAADPDYTEPTDPANPTDPTKPTDPSEPAKPTESSEPTEKPTETTKPATDPEGPSQTGEGTGALLAALLALTSVACLAAAAVKIRKFTNHS